MGRVTCAGSTVAQVRPSGTSGNRLYKLTTYMEFVWGEVSVNVPIFFDYITSFDVCSRLQLQMKPTQRKQKLKRK